MAKRNGYNVTAFDASGAHVLTNHVPTKVEAGRVARAFLAYDNVYTVEVDNAKYGDCGERVETYAKTSQYTAACISSKGGVRNVRISY